MNKELIVSATDSDIQLALLEDKQLVELHKDKTGNKIHVGDIYVGKVRKIMPGLNAAFIDVGEDKDGFVHYLDLGLNYNSLAKYVKLAMNGDPSVRNLNNFKIEPVLEKVGNLSNVLKVGQLIIGQVAKEPISTKGPKLSGDISFAGRYLVLTPFINRISISQKIKGSEERGRLRRLIQSIKPANFGVIVRTIAEGKDVAELDADLRQLIQPKLVGDSLGMPAIPTIVLLYVGFRVGGAMGLIIAVPIGMIVYNLYRAGLFSNFIYSTRMLLNDFRRMRIFTSEELKQEGIEETDTGFTNKDI